MATRDYKIRLLAGEEDQISQPGNYVKVINGTQPLRVIIDGQEGASVTLSQGRSLGPTREPFHEVRLLNESGVTVEATVVVGTAEIQDNAVTGSVSIEQGNAITDAAPVVVGVAAAALVAAGSGRKSLRFKNDGASTVYLGGAGVTVVNSPVQIAPGQVWIEDDAADAAWYGISASAGQSVRVQVVA